MGCKHHGESAHAVITDAPWPQPCFSGRLDLLYRPLEDESQARGVTAGRAVRWGAVALSGDVFVTRFGETA
jgi:hypothetical protein